MESEDEKEGSHRSRHTVGGWPSIPRGPGHQGFSWTQRGPQPWLRGLPPACSVVLSLQTQPGARLRRRPILWLALLSCLKLSQAPRSLEAAPFPGNGTHMAGGDPGGCGLSCSPCCDGGSAVLHTHLPVPIVRRGSHAGGLTPLPLLSSESLGGRHQETTRG